MWKVRSFCCTTHHDHPEEQGLKREQALQLCRYLCFFRLQKGLSNEDPVAFHACEDLPQLAVHQKLGRCAPPVHDHILGRIDSIWLDIQNIFHLFDKSYKHTFSSFQFPHIRNESLSPCNSPITNNCRIGGLYHQSDDHASPRADRLG